METIFLSQARSINISFELSIEWCYVARPNKFARRGAFQKTIQMLTLAFSTASQPEGPYQPYANRPFQGQWAGTRDHPYPETDMRRPIFTHPGERLSGSSDPNRPLSCLSHQVLSQVVHQSCFPALSGDNEKENPDPVAAKTPMEGAIAEGPL